MPRLPEDDYKSVLRPKCAVDLANIGLVTFLDAIHSTSKIDVEQAEQADQVRVHPIKNTITITTPDRQRADAYRTITELRNEKYNIDMPVAAYVPAPDDSIRGWFTEPTPTRRNKRSKVNLLAEIHSYRL
ncbi:hypothetical protein HPB49_001403 [Dermacentor silvarum]|uniref:Uncharacterized protein n=1 Tax=Dermacentor silvarum TaxID=543639 RepID=A0ACB8D216_DERSI|nr:hypothetical protein HPB49_001403 [Dermacentor silvarum]